MKPKGNKQTTKGQPTGPRLPRALFSTGFDAIATDWYKNPSAPKSLLPLVKTALTLEGLRVSEALIIAPKVSFKVYGENVVIGRLIDIYGVAGVEELLEEGAVEFVLWRGDVLKWDKPLPGLAPLAPFTATDPAHSDPQASVELGLKGWTNKPFDELRRLSALATERTILPAATLPDQAIKAVFAAYEAGGLSNEGFDPSVPIADVDTAQRDILSVLGSNVLEGMLLLENDYDIHEAAASWEALIKVCSKFTTDRGVAHTVESVLALEGLPSIPGLIRKGAISWGDVVQIRKHPATAEFRRWLWSHPDPRDTDSIARAYLAQITGKKAVDRDWFKTARVTAVNAVQTGASAAIGAAIAGTPGILVGGVAGLAMALADTFGLEKLLRGFSPRRFAEEVLRPRAAVIATAGGSERNRKERRAAAAQKRRKGR